MSDRPLSSSSPTARPRRLSQARLMESALRYLQRFSASEQQVRQLLQRKVQGVVREAERSAALGGGDVPDVSEAEAWIEAVIAHLCRLGYLDDQRFAQSRARSLSAQGLGQRAIRQKLAQKGVEEEIVRDALQSVAEEHCEDGEGSAAIALLDERAAIVYARKRRLGPWREAEQRADRREKDMAALCRRGFSYDIARRVIDGDGDESEPND